MSTLFPDGKQESMYRNAEISPCGLYRYALYRTWGRDGPRAIFVMLNPSTADHEVDDPTIRRCIGFARREGCGALTVINLFAFRATSPADMKAAADPVGIGNDNYIRTAWGRMSTEPERIVIAAWGEHGSFMGRDKAVRNLARCDGIKMKALALNASGAPKHPLYIKADAPLVPWPKAHYPPQATCAPVAQRD